MATRAIGSSFVGFRSLSDRIDQIFCFARDKGVGVVVKRRKLALKSDFIIYLVSVCFVYSFLIVNPWEHRDGDEIGKRKMKPVRQSKR